MTMDLNIRWTLLRRTAFWLLLFTWLWAPLVRGEDWADLIKVLDKSIAFVESEQGSCTAFVINAEKKYLLTADHCFGKEIWADRVRAKVISRDSKKDLMVIEAEHLDPAKVALKLAATNPVRGQAVMSVGYGYALERPFFRQSNVQDDQFMMPEAGVGGPYISVDSPFVGGQSGGPVVDVKGAVVSIVQRGDGGTTGLGVGADIIRGRMGRFFAQEKK